MARLRGGGSLADFSLMDRPLVRTCRVRLHCAVFCIASDRVSAAACDDDAAASRREAGLEVWGVLCEGPCKNPRSEVSFRRVSHRTCHVCSELQWCSVGSWRNYVRDLCRDTVPIDLCRDAAPIDLCRDAAPIDLCRDAAPIDLCRDVSPIDLCRDAAPIDLCRDAAPIDLCRDAGPIALWRDAARDASCRTLGPRVECGADCCSPSHSVDQTGRRAVRSLGIVCHTESEEPVVPTDSRQRETETERERERRKGGGVRERQRERDRETDKRCTGCYVRWWVQASHPPTSLLSRCVCVCHSLTHSLTGWLTHSLTHTLTLCHSLTHSLTHTLTLCHSLTHTLSLTHSHTHSLCHSLTHTLSLTHSHTHSLTLSVTHSLSLTHSHSLTHSLTQVVVVLDACRCGGQWREQHVFVSRGADSFSGAAPPLRARELRLLPPL